jgi:hypothetical protein
LIGAPTRSISLPTVRSLVEDFSATFNAIQSKAGRKLKVALVNSLKERLEKYETSFSASQKTYFILYKFRLRNVLIVQCLGHR